MKNLFLLLVLIGASSAPLCAQHDYRTAYSDTRRGDIISGDASDAQLRALLKSKVKKVVYFVSAEDCYSCMENMKVWIRFCDRYPGVKQVAIVQDASPKVAQEIRAHNSLSIPFLPDPDSVLCKHFRVLHTPVLIVLDTNNAVINYDKCGGSVVTPDSMMRYLPGDLSLLLHKTFSLTSHKESYELGAPSSLDFVPRDHSYYIIDKTFQRILKADTNGVIRGMIENNNKDNKMAQPLSLVVPAAQPGEYDVAVYDYNFMGAFLFYFKFNAPAAHQLVKVKKILEDSDFETHPGFILQKDRRILVPLSIMYTLWTDSTRIRQHRILGEMKDTINCLVVHPTTNSPALDTTFLNCYHPKGSPQKRTSPQTEPVIEKFPNDTLALFLRGSNRLSYLGKDLQQLGDVTLKLDDFDPDNCRDNLYHSYLVHVFPYRGKLLAVYLKSTMSPESNYAIRSNNYYVQLMARDGNPLTRAYWLRDLAKTNVFPSVAMDDKNRLCFVSKKEGQFVFSVYSLELR